MADLKAVVGRVQTKLDAGKTTEADLADNLSEFDALAVKYKNAKPTVQAQILGLKAQLYIKVLRQPEKALALFKQIKTNFSSARLDVDIDQVIAALEGMVEKKKIQDELAPGKPFPDFQETDLNGAPLSISKFKGKVVLVDFWATWCGPCIAELPNVKECYNKYHDKGFDVVGISLDQGRDVLEKFIEKEKLPWTQLFEDDVHKGEGWSHPMVRYYGINAIPAAILLDKEGKVVSMAARGEDLPKLVEKLLGKTE